MKSWPRPLMLSAAAASEDDRRRREQEAAEASRRMAEMVAAASEVPFPSIVHHACASTGGREAEAQGGREEAPRPIVGLRRSSSRAPRLTRDSGAA